MRSISFIWKTEKTSKISKLLTPKPVQVRKCSIKSGSNGLLGPILRFRTCTGPFLFVAVDPCLFFCIVSKNKADETTCRSF